MTSAISSADGAVQDPRPSLAALLIDPAIRWPLKAVLRSWADRDPVDAAEDANLLALAFERRADERIELGFRLRHTRDDHSEGD